MAHRQILISALDGRTLCLQFESESITGADVGARVAAVTGIPQGCLRLVTGTGEITSEMCLGAGGSNDGMLPSCSVVLRLRGGKGGFGSLLRGAATKAGQKKTSNFDACRDMSGRRLRHVNAEKKLKEWKAEAQERELEKAAEEFLKKDKKAKEENVGVYKELEKFRAETSRAMEEVGSAVVSGLAESRKLGADGKRKKIEAIAIQAKRSRVWMMDEDEEADLDQDAEEGTLLRTGDDELAMATTKKEDEGTEVSFSNTAETSSSESPSDNSSDKVVCAVLPADDVNDVVESLEKQANGISQDSEPSPTDDAIKRVCAVPSLEDGKEIVEGLEKQTSATISQPSDSSPTDDVSITENERSVADGPINFADFDSAKDLEILGLERLKTELQEWGLKCGGSLSERAGRLFLLKTTPLKNLDKKHFAAKSKSSKF
ncbi:unnamed protein product [Sphagnum jensenii]|uniref:Sde2 N-terminal ubiquitin domain-containing protein n=1 Tax=Sphagnum jensenii TaxID=128206 RepID=A0ABP1AA97_9BRYO